MTEKPFAVGDVVFLQSGSPAMTVTLLIDTGHIRTTWMSGAEVRSSRFPVESLSREISGYPFEWNPPSCDAYDPASTLRGTSRAASMLTEDERDHGKD